METFCYVWERNEDRFIRCMLLAIWRGTVYVLTAGGQERGYAEDHVIFPTARLAL